MSKWKRCIARLFNIQPEDLPQPPGTMKKTEQAVAITQEEITQFIQQRVKQVMKESILPELQDAISKQVSDHVDKLRQEILKQAAIAHKIEQPAEEFQEQFELEVSKSEQTIIQQLDEEFPVLEEEITPEVKAETLLPELEESIQIEEEVLPIEEEILPLFEEPGSLPFEKTQLPVLASIEGKQIRLGIDFGTTTTAVSIKFGDDLPVALPIGQDGVTPYIPSIVYFATGLEDLESRATVGEEAVSFNDPSRTVRSVKRCFACRGSKCRDGLQRSYCLGNGTIQLEGEEPLKPSYVAHLIVKEALRRSINYVRDRWQIDITQENVRALPINFGCGAKFDLDQRNLICEVATELGFKEFSIQNVVEEPILAGFAFTRFSKNPIGRSLIYDFGGGTFDAAIIEVDEEGENRRVTILATSADNWLGGDDIDAVVYKYFLEQIASTIPAQTVKDIEDSLSVNDAGRIRQRAKEAKEYLSYNNSYDVTFASPTLGLFDLHLDCSTFESLLAKSELLKRSIDVVKHACRLVYVYDEACLADSVNSQKIIRLTLKQAAAMIDHVVLVGGVTKIPYIRKQLAEIFGEEKIIQETVIEPVSAVAVGAAYPHDQGHFSIVVPPFGYFLTYGLHGRIVKDYLVKPFDFYDFNRCWATATVGSFTIPVKVLDGRSNAKLFLERAGEKEAKLLENWTTLGIGEWELTIDLDGTVGFQKRGQGMHNLPVEIPKHPRQQAIIDARNARDEKKLREERERRTLDEDFRSLLVDP